MTHRFIIACLATVAMPIGDIAAQQAYPERPVKIVVPAAAGGGTDTVARIMADQFSRTFGQQFFVENRGRRRRHHRNRPP